MDDFSSEDRSPLAAAYQWAWRIITLCLVMVLPGLVGLYVDFRLGTKVVFAILGFTGGMVFGVWRLIRIANSEGSDLDSSG